MNGTQFLLTALERVKLCRDDLRQWLLVSLIDARRGLLHPDKLVGPRQSYQTNFWKTRVNSLEHPSCTFQMPYGRERAPTFATRLKAQWREMSCGQVLWSASLGSSFMEFHMALRLSLNSSSVWHIGKMANSKLCSPGYNCKLKRKGGTNLATVCCERS